METLGYVNVSCSEAHEPFSYINLGYYLGALVCPPKQECHTVAGLQGTQQSCSARPMEALGGRQY